MRNFADYGIVISSTATGETSALCPRCSHLRKKKGVKCLSVNVEKGVWKCQHPTCNWSGTLYEKREEKKYVLPEYKPRAEMGERARAWFVSRGIPEQVLVRNKVTDGLAWMPQEKKEVACIQFPYFRGDTVVNVKYRDAHKNFKMEKDAERMFYKWNDLFRSDGSLVSHVVIVEGEIDALSFEVIGETQCISVPDGAPAVTAKNYDSKFDFLDSAIDILSQVERIYIAVDNDEPGQTLERELVRRLGHENCIKVVWPEGCKDANDVLTKIGGHELRRVVYEESQPYPVPGILAPQELTAEVLHEYRNGYSRLGVTTGWNELDNFYRPTLGQMCIVTGLPSSGKSEFLDALMVNAATLEGWRFGIYSPENYPTKYHAIKLAEKREGAPFSDGPRTRMSEPDALASLAWMQEHLRWINLGEEETPTLETILEKAKYLIRKFGIQGLVLDPYNEFDNSRASGQSETEYISGFLRTLHRFAQQHQICVWLVAHPTKLQKMATNKKNEDGTPIMTYQVPTPYDISGSSHWRNRADVCLAVHRLLDSEENIVEVHVQKMRWKMCGKVGAIRLKWDFATGRFSELVENFGAF